MNPPFRPVTCVIPFAFLAGFSSDAALARHKPIQHAKKADAASRAGHQRHTALKKGKHAAHVTAARREPAPSSDAPPQPAASPLSGDLASVKQAIDLARNAKSGEATAIEKTIGDPAARKLVEWFILRHPDGEAGFGRYAAFIADNPGWPSIGPLRRRAEGRPWAKPREAGGGHGLSSEQPARGEGGVRPTPGPPSGRDRARA